MNEEDRRAEVVAVAKEVLERAAPDQLPEFELYAAAWLADPERAMSPEGRREAPLGAGLGTELPNLAPLALYVAHHVLDAGFEVAVGETVRRGLSVFHRRRGKSEKTVQEEKARIPAESGSPEEIREKAVKAGTEFGARPQDVTLVANIFVLVLTAETSSTPATQSREAQSENPEES